MTISWFGQSFFRINTKNTKGEDLTLAIDPFSKDYGLKLPVKFGADILLVTHEHKDHNNVSLIKGTGLSPEPFLISGPGEYEIKGIMIYGVPSFHDDQQGTQRGENTIYLIESEDIWLAHLGDLGQKTLTPEQLEKLEGIDILMIPIGGTYTLDTKEANKLISQIEPRIIIPMHYQIPGLKLKLENLNKFIAETGLKPREETKF
ncbi:MAG TPA: lactamase, partial [Bacteroidetes bacterium]|nr:lactamase [Bacteroidota bacterium]